VRFVGGKDHKIAGELLSPLAVGGGGHAGKSSRAQVVVAIFLDSIHADFLFSGCKQGIRKNIYKGSVARGQDCQRPTHDRLPASAQRS
jgi:hypothetical protein